MRCHGLAAPGHQPHKSLPGRLGPCGVHGRLHALLDELVVEEGHGEGAQAARGLVHVLAALKLVEDAGDGGLGVLVGQAGAYFGSDSGAAM